jgi:predicted transposase/invertase (TIGR01784 family)
LARLLEIPAFTKYDTNIKNKGGIAMSKSNKTPDTPELLPPSEDGIFKSLLTRPESKPIVRDVLASYLNLPIKEVTVRNVETPIHDVGEKRQRFDINCTLDDDKQVEVEMQTEAMDGDSFASGHKNIKGRAILNLCDIHAKQEARGDDYKDMMRSYQITICGYTVFADKKEHINRFSFRDKNGYQLADSLWKRRFIHCTPSSGQFAPSLFGRVAALALLVPPHTQTDLGQIDSESVVQAINRHFLRYSICGADKT